MEHENLQENSETVDTDYLRGTHIFFLNTLQFKKYVLNKETFLCGYWCNVQMEKNIFPESSYSLKKYNINIL